MQLNHSLSTQENNETIECSSSLHQEDPFMILLYIQHIRDVKLENGSASVSF